jgi:outer membrane protein TolC
LNEAAYQSARSPLLPHVNGSVEISRSETPGVSSRLGGPDNNSVSAGINGQAILYDFGKTYKQFKAAGKSLDASKFDSQSVVATTILNARSAYYNYLLSAQVLLVNEDALQQMNLHYDQAKILFDVGKQAGITVTKAKVDVANAQVNVIHAKNALQLAKIQMDLVAGIALSGPLDLTDSLSTREDSLGMSEAQMLVLEKRPEINSLKARLDAARLQLSAMRSAFFPSLNATGSLGWGASNNAAITGSDFNAFPQWSIGASLSMPLYSGGFLDASVSNRMPRSNSRTRNSKRPCKAFPNRCSSIFFLKTRPFSVLTPPTYLSARLMKVLKCLRSASARALRRPLKLPMRR